MRISILIENFASFHQAKMEPRIIKFGYEEFKNMNDKWSAQCKKCSEVITEKKGMTSGFNRFPVEKQIFANSEQNHLPSLRLKMRFQSACLLLPLGVVLLFLSSADAPCFSGTREECKDVDFIPGHNLGGEGIDITTLARKDAYIFKMETTLNTNNTCTICKNMWMGRNEKLPLAIVDWRSIRKCKQSVTSKLYESSMSLASSSSNGVSNDWKVGLGFFPEPSTGVEVALSGSHSKVVEYAMGKAKKDKYSFSSQEVFCRYYRYRLKRSAELTPQFSTLLNSLPLHYNSITKLQYRQIINIYGTHYIRQVELGGKVREVTALKTCELALDGLTADEVKDCLGVEASVTAVSVKVSSAYKQCNKVKKKKLSQQKFSDKFSEREVEVTGGGGGTLTSQTCSLEEGRVCGSRAGFSL
ncbi:perforin-1-like isoform X2 [Latimeria chalumnae]|uniref:perforin-1-like isoform X2 n=1 Tax=Latimeria chalumnae TaxID=7897 RepID=UPI00313E2A5C